METPGTTSRPFEPRSLADWRELVARTVEGEAVGAAEAALFPADAESVPIPLPAAPARGWRLLVGLAEPSSPPGEARRRRLRELGVDGLLVPAAGAAGAATAPDLPVELDAGPLLVEAHDLARAWARQARANGGTKSPTTGRAPGRALHANPLAISPNASDEGSAPGGESGGEPGPALAALLELCERELPGVPCLSAPGTLYHEAGAGPDQELAGALAATAGALRLLEAAGVAVERAWPRLVVHLAAEPDPFLTLAKLRAARWLWQHLGRACGIADSASPPPVQARVSGRSLSPRSPWVNLLRVTASTLGAVLGGADSIVVHPERLALPAGTAQEDRLAVCVSHILREEALLERPRDPAAGSGAAEALTRAFATGAWQLFQEIEAHGGLAAVLADGWLHDRIAAVREHRERTAMHVGVNAFLDEGPGSDA